MDPFSVEGELLNLVNHFYQGQWQQVIDFDTSGLSSENALPARIFSLRAQIALGQAEDVVADIQGEQEPELRAVGALAGYASGQEEKSVQDAEQLAADFGANAVVQVIAGTVLQAAGKSEEALALLSQHQGSCITHRVRETRLLWLTDNSGSSCSHRTNSPPTKSHRSSREGSSSSSEMGAGQPACQSCRVMGGIEGGELAAGSFGISTATYMA